MHCSKNYFFDICFTIILSTMKFPVSFIIFIFSFFDIPLPNVPIDKYWYLVIISVSNQDFVQWQKVFDSIHRHRG